MTKTISFGYIRLLSLFGLTIEYDLYRPFYFVNTLLELKRSVEYIMAEVFICRGGGRAANVVNKYGQGGGTLKTVNFTANNNYTLPKAIDNLYYVRCVGGGAGGSSSIGGGSGYMTNEYLNLAEGTVVTISIGAGGSSAKNNRTGGAGGTTSFGPYLSANGGNGGNGNYWNRTGGSGGAGGYGYRKGGTGYLWGGGAGGSYGDDANNNYGGGNGGPWGGGGAAVGMNTNAGCGGVYGGGGAAYMYGKGGNGGKYGGGGGSIWGIVGIGGTYGGNGGNANLSAENGTNTIGWTNVETLNQGYVLLTGNGIAQFTRFESFPDSESDIGNNTRCCGGGGFGGMGGYSCISGPYAKPYNNSCTGGGGGYGSNGGGYAEYGARWACGGGGGYGGDGGDRGGGGGYGKEGSVGNVGYGGGGYYQNTGHDGGAGALGYGNGGDSESAGQQGVIILQYYA